VLEARPEGHVFGVMWRGWWLFYKTHATEPATGIQSHTSPLIRVRRDYYFTTTLLLVGD
jgi:hypothetical protein